ncbi:MAG: hypothetical protein D3926_16190 [Desulfobacteraceae bacterium]|nr:MAG: hypothetical protein D3926_16190 [Desulfobacteraceae bacterium]
MILHDFIYSWDGKTHADEKPVAWWPGSYRVRIVKLDSGHEGVKFIKPMAVILKNNSSGTSLRNYIENFAKKMSRQYDLELEKTLWVELDDGLKVARINEKRHLQNGPLYLVDWREARPNEQEMLKPFLKDFE